MDILFKNTYTRTKNITKEMFRYLCFQRKINIFIYITLGIGFFMSLVPAFWGESYNMTIFYAILILFYLFFYVFFYFIQVNVAFKRDVEIAGKEVEAETIVTDEFIQVTVPSVSVNKLEFHNINRVIQTKNLILLLTKAKLIYTLRKDSFTVGSKDEFVAFLKSKGIAVKGK